MKPWLHQTRPTSFMDGSNGGSLLSFLVLRTEREQFPQWTSPLSPFMPGGMPHAGRGTSAPFNSTMATNVSSRSNRTTGTDETLRPSSSHQQLFGSWLTSRRRWPARWSPSPISLLSPLVLFDSLLGALESMDHSWTRKRSECQAPDGCGARGAGGVDGGYGGHPARDSSGSKDAEGIAQLAPSEAKLDAARERAILTKGPDHGRRPSDSHPTSWAH